MTPDLRPPRPPEELKEIARTLERAGHETWVVGGVLRDWIIGLKGGDWDLATGARPGKVRSLFRRTVPVGLDHGTVGVFWGGGRTLYQVTTFRKDVETDGRRAVVRFAERVEDDLARRDFTINALAWHPLRDEWLDLHGGRRDLEAGVLRAVGVAEARFGEDFLRILRGLRFAGRLDLGIEPRTWKAMCATVENLVRLSAERVREELVKVLSDTRPGVALRLYADSGALGALYPEIAAFPAPVWEATLEAVDYLPPTKPYLRLAALLRSCGLVAVEGLAERLKLSRVEGRMLVSVVKALPVPALAASDAELRRWLSEHGRDALGPAIQLEIAHAATRGKELPRTPDGESGPEAADNDGPDVRALIGALRRMRILLDRGDPLGVSDLAITGDDLLRMGIEPGPLLGRTLRRLLEEVIEDPDMNRTTVLETRARTWAARG